MSLVDAPSARFGHTAVWTGDRMLIWGGANGPDQADVLGDGHAYDPTTDSWTPMSNIGAPAARTDHTGVWTGDEWIIWGGDSDLVSNYGDGFRYNPATDTWTQISDVDRPGQFAKHSAIWTGGRMVVFGGFGGGRYIPSTDSWEPMADSPLGIDVPMSSALMGEEIAYMHFPALRSAYSLEGIFYTITADLDNDGVIDQEDCEPNNASVSTLPVDINGFLWNADETSFTWTTTGDTYDVARGAIGEWPTGSGASETCHDTGLAVASSSDASVPAVDSGFWYLVRGVNACGPGSYGNNSQFVRNLEICP